VNLTADAVNTITLAVWIVVTVLAFLGGAWLMAQLRGEEDLMLADQLAKKQIDIDQYRAKASLTQP
jgi:hypothetical protein